MLIEVDSAFASRFWGKVDTSDPEGCWPWEASRAGLGYGQVQVADGVLLPGIAGIQAAHRVAYFLAHRRWPGDLYVLHSCDNPPCVQPAHLRLGTAADNAADMINRSRHRWDRESRQLTFWYDEPVWGLRAQGKGVSAISRLVGISRPTVYKSLERLTTLSA